MPDELEIYYPIKESEISHFVRSSGPYDQSTRSLASTVYSRGAISLSGDVKLMQDLQYRIYKLENTLKDILHASFSYPPDKFILSEDMKKDIVKVLYPKKEVENEA